jgi:hypothetical protein
MPESPLQPPPTVPGFNASRVLPFLASTVKSAAPLTPLVVGLSTLHGSILPL